MSKILKTLASCLITLFITAVVIAKLGHLVRPVKTDIAFNTFETFDSMPKNTFEVIGYGSSHIWRGMSPMEMYQKYGIGAYNYGCSWQHINTTELFLKNSLQTQSPKVVLVETYLVNDLLQDTDMNGEIYYTRGIIESADKQQYLRQCFGNNKERYLSYYMPLCAFHDNWVDLKYDSFIKSADDTDFYATMGYLYTDDVEPVTIADPSTFKQNELSDSAIAVLDKIVEVCHTSDIEIIFYTAPWEGSYPYGDAMKKYAQENGAIYLNLFEYLDEMGINCETDFNDYAHVNNSGAVKISDFLGEYIVNHYVVTDMRKVNGNIWQQQMQKN